MRNNCSNSRSLGIISGGRMRFCVAKHLVSEYPETYHMNVECPYDTQQYHMSTNYIKKKNQNK